MAGGTASTEDLIKATKRACSSPAPGTSAWSTRRRVLLTGLTRDGTFMIENGKITFPVKNFRFNESPVIIETHEPLSNITMSAVSLLQPDRRGAARRASRRSRAAAHRRRTG